MLLLTKLDHRQILLSLESVKYFEAIPDTLVLFHNGDNLIVRESLAEIQAQIKSYQQAVFSQSFSDSPSAPPI